MTTLRMFEIHEYVFSTDPSLVPLSESGKMENYDVVVRACGENPDDEEITNSILSEDWNGHKAGSDVIIGLATEGSSFYVIENICKE